MDALQDDIQGWAFLLRKGEHCCSKTSSDVKGACAYWKAYTWLLKLIFSFCHALYENVNFHMFCIPLICIIMGVSFVCFSLSCKVLRVSESTLSSLSLLLLQLTSFARYEIYMFDISIILISEWLYSWYGVPSMRVYSHSIVMTAHFSIITVWLIRSD